MNHLYQFSTALITLFLITFIFGCTRVETMTHTQSNSAIASNIETLDSNVLNTSTIRINAGGEEYISTNGTLWQADYGFESTGTPYQVRQAIAKTDEQLLYQTERYGTDLRYSFLVANGQYNLKLHFAELYVTQPDERVFHIDINGQRVLSNFDIVAEAGSAYSPIIKIFTVNISNGRLEIDFPAVTQQHWGKISAIELIPS